MDLACGPDFGHACCKWLMIRDHPEVWHSHPEVRRLVNRSLDGQTFKFVSAGIRERLAHWISLIWSLSSHWISANPKPFNLEVSVNNLVLTDGSKYFTTMLDMSTCTWASQKQLDGQAANWKQCSSWEVVWGVHTSVPNLIWTLQFDWSDLRKNKEQKHLLALENQILPRPFQGQVWLS